MVLDGCVFELDASPSSAMATAFAEAPPLDTPHDEFEQPICPSTHRAPSAAETGLGEFTTGIHTQGPHSRQYKLYQPPGNAGRQRPLVVMLHGCTQDPDDFAAGTAMNQHAAEQGLFVLYPAQAQDANPHRCWNWFQPGHQQRDSGEPALIAGMTRAVLAQHGIDASRVFVAGLSAGGAMAAIVAGAYPDIFAALGVHSGLPSGAASDLVGALAVMKRGAAGTGLRGNANHHAKPQQAAEPPHPSLPTIVFHGDQDRTVHSRNGQQLIAAALGRADGSPATTGSTFNAPPARIEQGVSSQGRRYTRSIHLDDQGRAIAEHWLLHGAGHAWSGGNSRGSYTDAKGPDATLEMLRFFLDHPKARLH